MIGVYTNRGTRVNPRCVQSTQTVYNTKGTRAHTHRELILGGAIERVRVRRHYGPLCSKLVAAVSGSICIAVLSSLRRLLPERDLIP